MVLSAVPERFCDRHDYTGSQRGHQLSWAIFFVIAGLSTFAIVIENFMAKLSSLMPVLLRL